MLSSGKRVEKYFDTLREARNWLEDTRHDDRHGKFSASSDMTVDDWFGYWMKYIVCDLSPNTQRNYYERYRINIHLLIGGMKINDVKPLHCKVVLNSMNAKYSGDDKAGIHCHGNAFQIRSHERRDT